MLDWGRNWGWGKKVAVVLAILMVLNIPKFVEIYDMLQHRPQGPVSSSEHPMFDACMATVGYTQAASGSPQSAFCNCYTAAAIFQRYQKNDYPAVPEEDFPLLLQAIAGERPGQTRPQSPSAQPLPAHVQGFVSAVLPQCREKAIARAERLRHDREGAVPQTRTASNRQPGDLRDFHEACVESQGVSWQSASIAQKALCQCYYVESRVRHIPDRDMPALLEAIDGKQGMAAGEKQKVDDFLRESLPRCRKRSAAIAASTER
jgi:hypothetical protein